MKRLPAFAFAALLLASGCTSMQDLIVRLNSGTPDSRVEVANRLGRMRHKAKPAVPALIKNLNDDNEDVRIACGWALGRVGTVAMVELLDALLHDNPRVQNLAALAYGVIGHEAVGATIPLYELAKNENSKVRASAAWALGQTTKRDGVQVLIGTLRHKKDAHVRTSMTWTMGLIGREAMETELLPNLLRHGLKDEDPRVRERSAWAIGEIYPLDRRHKENIHALVDALGDKDESVRARVVSVFELHTHKEISIVLDKLKEATIKDESARVRAGACRAIGALGEHGRTAFDALGKALGDDDLAVRDAAFWALADVGVVPKDKLPIFIKILRRKNDDWRHLKGQEKHAQHVLMKSGRRVVADLVELKTDKSFETRAALAWALARAPFDKRKTVPALISLLRDEHPTVRTAAALAFVEVAETQKKGHVRKAIPAVVEALKDDDPLVSDAAGQALKKFEEKGL